MEMVTKLESMLMMPPGSLDDEMLQDLSIGEIHSGHFMVSNLNESGSEDGEEALPQDPDPVGYDFRNATQEPSKVYTFGTGGVPRFGIDDSLTTLFDCLTIAYSGKISNPKWNQFRGLKLALKNKIRLNNIIWREYHMQFVKKTNPVVVQFASPLTENHGKPEAVVMEGKYWKRRLQTICNEYKRWRVYFMKQSRLDEDRNSFRYDNDYELLEQTAQRGGRGRQPSRCPSPPVSLDDLMMDIDDNFDFLLDHPLAFPNPRDLTLLGNADIMQPGLIQLQPCLDDYQSDHLLMQNLFQPVPSFDQSALLQGNYAFQEQTQLPPTSSQLFYSSSSPFQQQLHQEPHLGNITPGQNLKLSSYAGLSGSSAAVQASSLTSTRPHSNSGLVQSVSLHSSSFNHFRYSNAPVRARAMAAPSHALQMNTAYNSRISASPLPPVAGQTTRPPVPNRGTETPNLLSALLQSSIPPSAFVQTPSSTPVLKKETLLHKSSLPGPPINYGQPTKVPVRPIGGSSFPNEPTPSNMCSASFMAPKAEPTRRPVPIAPRSGVVDGGKQQCFPASNVQSSRMTSATQQPASAMSGEKDRQALLAFINQVMSGSSSGGCTQQQSGGAHNNDQHRRSLAAVSGGAQPSQQQQLQRQASLPSPVSISSYITFPSGTGVLNSSPPPAPPPPPPPPAPHQQHALLESSSNAIPSSVVDFNPALQLTQHHQQPSPTRALSSDARRRGNIQANLDILHRLLISRSSGSRNGVSLGSQHLSGSATSPPGAGVAGSKVSKAALLHKAADQIRRLRADKAAMEAEAARLRNEIEQLQNAISTWCAQLPATGVAVNNRQRTNQGRDWFDSYVRAATLTNWKFYIFSLIIGDLFDTFGSSVTTTSVEQMVRTLSAWLDQHCSLVKLRPVVMQAMRRLSTTTSILQEPNRVPMQVTAAAMAMRTSEQRPARPRSAAGARSSGSTPAILLLSSAGQQQESADSGGMMTQQQQFVDDDGGDSGALSNDDEEDDEEVLIVSLQ